MRKKIENLAICGFLVCHRKYGLLGLKKSLTIQSVVEYFLCIKRRSCEISKKNELSHVLYVCIDKWVGFYFQIAQFTFVWIEKKVEK